MKKSELAGLTALAITLISLNVFNGQDNGKLQENKASAPVSISKIVPDEDKPFVVEVQTSSAWSAGESSFRSFDY